MTNKELIELFAEFQLFLPPEKIIEYFRAMNKLASRLGYLQNLCEQ